MLALDPQWHAAVIFDCDGTLVDSMPLHFDAWRDAFREHGATFEFSWDLFTARAGMTLERTVQELNAQFGDRLDPERVAMSQRAAFRSRRDELGRVTFVAEFARELRGTVPMAVASGSNDESVRHALTRTNMLAWFDVLVTSSDPCPCKPAPDVFLLAAQKLSVPPARCLVVEDSRLGIEAAHRAGMDAYLIDRDGSALFCAGPGRLRPQALTRE